MQMKNSNQIIINDFFVNANKISVDDNGIIVKMSVLWTKEQKQAKFWE